MTDERRARAAAEDRTETRRPARRIPPLVWIVIFLLVAWFAWAWVQRAGTDVTPHGGTMPREAERTSAAPPNGSAPATPAQTVNGPQEPRRR